MDDKIIPTLYIDYVSLSLKVVMLEHMNDFENWSQRYMLKLQQNGQMEDMI